MLSAKNIYPAVKLLLSFGILIVWGSVIGASTTFSEYGNKVGDADFDDDNGIIIGQYDNNTYGDTWANAAGSLIPYDPTHTHQLWGGAFDQKSWTGSIASNDPSWDLTLEAQVDVRVWSSRWNWEEMDTSARNELTLWGDWTDYDAREVEDVFPTTWDGTYDITIYVGFVAYTLADHGRRWAVPTYGSFANHWYFTYLGFRASGLQQSSVAFTYMSYSSGHVHMEFSSRSNDAYDNVNFSVDHKGQTPFYGLLISWDGSTPVDSVPLY